MARVPGPEQLSRTRDSGLIAVPDIVLSMLPKRDEMVAASENIFISLATTIRCRFGEFRMVPADENAALED